MRMLTMRDWIRALFIACALEFFATALLIALTPGGPPSRARSLVGQALVLYHILSIPFAQAMLTLWNSPPRPQPATGSSAIYWLSLYIFQVLLTFPIAYVLLKWILRLRQKKGESGDRRDVF